METRRDLVYEENQFNIDYHLRNYFMVKFENQLASWTGTNKGTGKYKTMKSKTVRIVSTFLVFNLFISLFISCSRKNSNSKNDSEIILRLHSGAFGTCC